MKKLAEKSIATILLLLISSLAFSQDKKENIAKSITDYFFLERENIHAHFDKTVFMTNENVWFKGYVFHRKKNVPFFSTVNIFATLIDENGTILDKQLIYGNIGSFSGNFKLNDDFKSGKYYIQFYTNWMNNFSEDESAVYEITVVNPTMGPGTAFAKADPATININFNPEGGTFLNGVKNVIGLNVTDCNNAPLAVSSVEILDSKNEVLKKVLVNKLGYGKFEIEGNANENYKAVVKVNGQSYEKALPKPENSGLAMEVNNYAVPGKTVVSLKTNSFTTGSIKESPLYLVIHKDEKSIIYEVDLSNKLEEKFVIPNDNLFSGMNTIRIIDNKMSQIAERLIYMYPESTLNSDIAKESETDNEISFKGKVSYPNMNLSISYLPENTLGINEKNDIYSSFLIAPYLDNENKTSGKYYFSNMSKGKKFELDLFLINQESKYKWHSITSSPPKNNVTFDMGITLKGTVPASAGNIKDCRVRLFSLSPRIDEFTDINENREFYFEHLIIPDSAYVNFSLVKKDGKSKEINIVPQIPNGLKSYNKPYKPAQKKYIEGSIVNIPGEGDYEMPNILDETVMLDEVQIDGQALKYAKSFGNGNLRAYKITEQQANSYYSLINFIKAFGGFNVSDVMGGSIQITSRTTNSINGGASSPIVYVDNVQLIDYEMLRTILMSEVDEIYMSPHAIVPSVRNYMGIIRVYLKKGAKVNSKNKTVDIVVKNGFKRMQPFENVVYNSTADTGFENFGIIDWEPNIMTDENGEFSFTIPKIYNKPIKVLIEGFSADGKLISEVKTINL